MQSVQIQAKDIHDSQLKSVLIAGQGLSQASRTPGFFQPIVDANLAGVARVYTASEGLFGRLQDELRRWSDWTALGGLDLEEFADTNLTELADWEMNFQMLKVVLWWPYSPSHMTPFGF